MDRSTTFLCISDEVLLSLSEFEPPQAPVVQHEVCRIDMPVTRFKRVRGPCHCIQSGKAMVSAMVSRLKLPSLLEVEVLTK